KRRRLATDLHVEAQALHFLDENVERFRCARFERVIALDDRLINPGPALYVIGFNGEQFLQSIGGSVSLQGPHFHFTKTLATVLRLSTERLLSNERVRSYCASVNLVRHQVTKFHHIDVAHHNFLIERIAGASVEKLRLTAFLHPGESLLLSGVMQIFADLFFLDSVEHRGPDLESQRFRGNPQVCFENLSYVHTAGHTQRVKDNFNRRAICQERHVFFGHDPGDHALISVPPGHLVTDAWFALARDVNLDLFDDSRV